MAEDWDEGISHPWQEPVPDEVRKFPSKSKKDTKRWCKGKVGREHQPEHRINSSMSFIRKCGPVDNRRWSPFVTDGWECREQIVCSACGKILQWFLTKKDCSFAKEED